MFFACVWCDQRNRYDLSRQIAQVGEDGAATLRYPFYAVSSKGFAQSGEGLKREMNTFAFKEFQRMKSVLGMRLPDYEREVLDAAIASKEEETFKASVRMRERRHSGDQTYYGKKNVSDSANKGRGRGAYAKAIMGTMPPSQGLKERHKNRLPGVGMA